MNKLDQDKKTFINSLSQIAKGSGIVFIGFLCYSLFFLFSNIVIARIWGQTNFGVFSLAFSILSILAVISCLGLDRGITRNIAFYQGKKNNKVLPRLILSSVLITLLTSIFAGLFLFIASEFIAQNIFQTPSLIDPLRIFSFVLPVFNLLIIFSSVFRGYHDIKPMVYFQHISLSLLFAFFLIPLFFFDVAFITVFYAYLGASAFSLIFLLVYIRVFRSFSFDEAQLNVQTAKNLILFSLPLVGTAILQRIIRWTDTIMIGGIQTAATVGLYNAARPISLFLTFPLSALLMMYTPVISSMYGEKKHDHMRQSFTIMTRWLSYLTIPLFLVFFLFSEHIIGFFFGSTFKAASMTLQILSIGAILHNLTGPNGAYLLALGKSRFILYASMATAGINIGLNSVLIPLYGIEGAAVASSISIVSVNIIKCFYLYRIHQAHPIEKTMILPALISIGISIIMIYLVQQYVMISILMIPLILIIFYGIMAVSLICTRSLKSQDVQMIEMVAEKIHLDLSLITRFLKKFTK